MRSGKLGIDTRAAKRADSVKRMDEASEMDASRQDHGDVHYLVTGAIDVETVRYPALGDLDRIRNVSGGEGRISIPLRRIR